MTNAITAITSPDSYYAPEITTALLIAQTGILVPTPMGLAIPNDMQVIEYAINENDEWVGWNNLWHAHEIKETVIDYILTECPWWSYRHRTGINLYGDFEDTLDSSTSSGRIRSVVFGVVETGEVSHFHHKYRFAKSPEDCKPICAYVNGDKNKPISLVDLVALITKYQSNSHGLNASSDLPLSLLTIPGRATLSLGVLKNEPNYTLTTTELILRDKMNACGFIVSLEADPTWKENGASTTLSTNPLYTEKMLNQALADLESLAGDALCNGWRPVLGRLTTGSPTFIYQYYDGEQVELSANVDEDGNPIGDYYSVLKAWGGDGLEEIYVGDSEGDSDSGFDDIACSVLHQSDDYLQMWESENCEDEEEEEEEEGD